MCTPALMYFTRHLPLPAVREKTPSWFKTRVCTDVVIYALYVVIIAFSFFWSKAAPSIKLHRIEPSMGVRFQN